MVLKIQSQKIQEYLKIDLLKILKNLKRMKKMQNRLR